MLNSGMTETYIAQKARAYFARRRERVGSIRSAQDVVDRQKEIKTIYSEILGPFPARSPLNVKSIQILQREGYSVECLTYQSLPGVVTTANLYLPKSRSTRCPAIICLPAHWPEGKAQAEYQRMGQLLARRGMAALIFDHVGQGERFEFYDSTLRRSWLGTSVADETAHLGNFLFLTGHHLANWMLWDAMRGIDLLQERETIDATRIGVTGYAESGALTRLLCCLEPRIAAAVICADNIEPESLGGENIGQCCFNAVARGVSLLDVLMPFAPKPLLLAACSADRAAQQLQENVAGLSGWYGLLNASEKLASYEADGPHGYIRVMRNRTAEFFGSTFGLAGERAGEPATPPESAENLYCTETGQVGNSLNAVSVFDFHRELTRKIPLSLPVPRDLDGVQLLQDEIRTRILPHLRLPEPADPIKCEIESHSTDWGYMAEKGRLLIDEGLYVPYSFYALQTNTDDPGGRRAAPTVLVLHESGIAAVSKQETWMRGFALAGVHVMAIDVCGIGETRLQPKDEDSNPYNTVLCGDESRWARRALNVGLNLFGLRVFSVLRTLAYLRTRWDVDQSRISFAGVGRGGLWGLYAAVLDRDVSSVVLIRSLASYKRLIEHRRHNHHFGLYLPGCLRDFDLPHVALCVAPRSLTLINAINQRKERCDINEVNRDYALTSAVYRLHSAERHFNIINSDSAPETFNAVKGALPR